MAVSGDPSMLSRLQLRPDEDEDGLLLEEQAPDAL